MMDKPFLSHASQILADTQVGLSGSEIIRLCNEYAVKFNKEIKFNEYPFLKNVRNKAEALYKNLICFEEKEQLYILKKLCNLDKFTDNERVKDLYLILIRDYGCDYLEIDQDLYNDFSLEKNWLDNYPDVKTLYETALEKKNTKLYSRNLLDDLRLAFEKLTNEILNNKRSLENNKSLLGNYFKENNINTEIANLYISVVFDFFSKYQNNNVKHGINFKEKEVDFIFDITTILMKFLVKLD